LASVRVPVDPSRFSKKHHSSKTPPHATETKDRPRQAQPDAGRQASSGSGRSVNVVNPGPGFFLSAIFGTFPPQWGRLIYKAPGRPLLGLHWTLFHGSSFPLTRLLLPPQKCVHGMHAQGTPKGRPRDHDRHQNIRILLDATAKATDPGLADVSATPCCHSSRPRLMNSPPPQQPPQPPRSVHAHRAGASDSWASQSRAARSQLPEH